MNEAVVVVFFIGLQIGGICGLVIGYIAGRWASRRPSS